MIKTEEQYNALCQRVDELFKIVGFHSAANDRHSIEYFFLMDLIADYEERHFSEEEE